MTSKEALKELMIEQQKLVATYTDKDAKTADEIMVLFKAISKDLEFLESIKKCIWKSEDNYYIDLCISRYGDTKNIYELLEQCEFEIKEK